MARSVAFMAALLGAAALGAHQPPAAPPPADEEVELLKVAKDAELHGVAVYGPAIRFSQNDLKNWPLLVLSLRHSRGKEVDRVRQYLSADVKRLLHKDGIVDDLEVAEQKTFPPVGDPQDARLLKAFLPGCFSRLIEDRDFHSAEHFKHLATQSELKRLIELGAKRTMHQTARMNWALLHALFPESVADVPVEFGIVRVQVRTGTSVVLVLSGSESCAWEVDVKPGSRVVGVILCGSGAQEVRLHENPLKDVPAVYRAYHAPDGTPAGRTAKYFDGREVALNPKSKIDPRKQFEDGVKELTGKGEFVSMQRLSRPKNELLSVPPQVKPKK